MKRVCFITTIPATMRAFVLPAAEYLHSTGEYDITLICDKDEAFAASLPDFYHYEPVPMARGVSLSGFSAMLAMRRIFAREHFDLVQYSTPNASCYAAIAAWLARVPERLYCQWGIAYVGFSGMKRRIFKALEGLTCALSTCVEPDSFGNLRFSKSERLYNEKKGHVVGNGSAAGIDLEKYDIEKRSDRRREIRARYSIPEEAFVFGFVGRLDRDKGVNELLTAFLSLARRFEDIRLMIVGPDDKLPSLDQDLYAASLKEPRIIYCGATDEIEKYYPAMDVFVLPSYREGFGNVVIEAEAMNTPVIVTDIPGPSEAMLKDETGLLVKKADAASLEAAMGRMYTDRGLTARLASSCRAFVQERFDMRMLLEEIRRDRDMLIEKQK